MKNVDVKLVSMKSKDQGKNGAGAIQIDMWDLCFAFVFEMSIRMVEVHLRILSPEILINSQLNTEH